MTDKFNPASLISNATDQLQNKLVNEISGVISPISQLNQIIPNDVSNLFNQSTSQINNAFTHDPANVVASANTSNEFTFDFQSNILDNYDTYTYHWKLFITPLESAATGKVLDKDSQTIIAESGVSDLTIDKVEIHGIAVPSIEAGTGTQTTVKFEIVEPSGAGLLDKLFYQAVSLGIGNWLVMPCFLQLEFRGRDPKTAQSVINGGPSGLASLKWVWPIKLTNSKINVSTVGTRYEFDAIIYNELAQSNSYFGLQHNVVLKELTTFGKAMKDLENKLNADQYEKLIDNYSIPDTYKIVVDPILEGIPLALPDANKSTSRAGDYVDFNKKTASYNSGTAIDKIVDSLLGSTSAFQKKMQNSDTQSSQPKSSNQETDQMKKLWRVVTETRPIAYDMLRQDNAVAITIFIIEYDLGVTDVVAAQTGQTPETLPAAKKRMVEYIKKKIMNKKYNYIFTGLNDQIIALDLNMNYSFASALSRFGGIYYDSATKDIGVANQNNAENEKKAAEQVRQTLQFVNNASTSDDVDGRIAQAKKAIADSKIDPANIQRYTTLLENAKPVQRTALTTAIQQAGGIASNGSLSSAKKTATSLAKPTANGLKFVSDVDASSQAAQNAFDIAQTNRKGKLRPIPYREGAHENNFVGIDPASNAGRNRTSSIFATALYSTLDASLQTIKMTIKGDPYWLFPRSIGQEVKVLPYKASMSKDDAIKDIKSAQKLYPYSVNMYGTDNFIVIRFRTPRVYNETTGVIDPYTEVETFSGVYKVVTVVSKFDMGKFSQELTCILDPVINLSDFLKDIENATKHQDPTTATSLPLNLPIKAARIFGDVNIPAGIDTVIQKVQSDVGNVLGTITSNIPTSPTDVLTRISNL